MSENNNSLDNMNNGSSNNQDNDLEQLLFQVFGSKENLEKEKKKMMSDDALAAARMVQREKSPDIRFEQDPDLTNASGKEHHNVKKVSASNVHTKGAHSGDVKKKAQSVNNGKKNAAKNGQAKSKAGANKQALKVQNRKAVAAVSQSVSDKSDKAADEKTKNMPKILQKIAAMSGKKKAAAIAGLLGGIVLIFALIVVGLFFFYTSLFGKYHGDKNYGKYQYNSNDYASGANTITAEDAEAALKKQLAGKATDLMKDKDVMNIMLIGEDLRDTSAGERGNTDVMMLISLNQKTKTITMTSFLRDAWVYIDDYGMAKLNAAYWRDGPSLLKKTIEDHYGVSIDRYVIVNFKSFIEIIDTIGGIDMDVTDEEALGMHDPMAEQNNLLGKEKGTDYLYKGGKQLHLNGNQALAFARLRYVGNADYERTQRQRRVISEIIKETKKLSFIKINDLATKIFPQVKLDITTGEFASLLLNSLDYLDYDVQELRIPADGLFTEDIIDGLSVLSPDFNANRELLISTIYGTGEDSSSGADESELSSDNGQDQTVNGDYNYNGDYNNYNNYGYDDYGGYGDYNYYN